MPKTTARRANAGQTNTPRAGRFVGCAAALLLLASLAHAEPVVPRGARRLDGIAAVVGARAPGGSALTILRSDVELRARLALAAAGAAGSERGVLPPSLLRATLEELVGEALIAAEARRLAMAGPSDLDITRECTRFATSVGGAGRFQKWLQTIGVDDAEMRALCRRRAVVGRFLAANLESTLDPTPVELERAYREEAHPFKGQPFEDVRDALSAWLGRRRAEEAVASWVTVLKQRTPYRILAGFER